MKPQLVVFDLDNTLYDYQIAHEFALDKLIQSVSKLSGLTYQQTLKNYIRAKSKTKKILHNVSSSHSRLLYITHMTKEYNISSTKKLELENLYWISFFSKMKLRANCQELLQLLKFKGIETALITDFETRIQYRKLSILNLENYFDTVVTSEMSGADKISGSPFKYLEKELGKKYKYVWFIGDSENDFPSEFGNAKIDKFLLRNEFQSIDQAIQIFSNYGEIITLLEKIE
jgi:putative hydrolase of the HAD superfamily